MSSPNIRHVDLHYWMLMCQSTSPPSYITTNMIVVNSDKITSMKTKICGAKEVVIQWVKWPQASTTKNIPKFKCKTTPQA